LLRGEATLFELRAAACRPLVDLLPVFAGDIVLTTARLSRRFDVLLADPPWYPEVTHRFLLAASRILVDGGQLLLCIPGLGTRPGLLHERDRLSRWAAECSLVPEALEVGVVEYESPPFELAALSAAGLECYDPRWRRGDLLVFRRLPGDSAGLLQVETQPPLPLNDWHEATIGRSSVRIDLRHAGVSDDFVAHSIVAGDVLDTVSARDERRSRANVWTSSNRIFEVSHPQRLLDCLRSFSELGNLGSRQVVEFAQHLVLRETEFLQGLGLE
jgi:hypothetical protein